MQKFIVSTVLALGIAALLPAGCIPGVGASNTHAPAAPSLVVVPS